MNKTAQKLSDIIEQISSSSAYIEAYMNDGTGEIGSGFFVTPRVICTCAHVVGLSPSNTNPSLRAIVVTTKNGNKYYASIVDFDVNLDIAVLYVNIPQTEKQYFLNLGNSGTIKEGEAIITLGNPLGYSSVVSYGIVSKADLDNNKRFFLADLRVNSGNSGGLIFSLEKQAVIGVAAAILNSQDGTSQGLSVGISIDPVKAILKNNNVKFVYKENEFE